MNLLEIITAVRELKVLLFNGNFVSAPVSQPARTTREQRGNPTTDFSPLRHRRVACILDVENLAVSTSKNFGHSFQPHALMSALKAAARTVSGTAVFTHDPKGRIRRGELENAGFRVVEIPRETIAGKLRANADASISFTVGAAAARLQNTDAVLIGSGDFDVVAAAARGIRRIHGRRVQIFCAGVPGSISSGLQDRRDLLDAPPILLQADSLNAELRKHIPKGKRNSQPRHFNYLAKPSRHA